MGRQFSKVRRERVVSLSGRLFVAPAGRSAVANRQREHCCFVSDKIRVIAIITA
jgi:hypothetical protein